MTAIETSVANWFSTALSASVSNADTTFSVNSIGTLVSPAYIVLDPDDNSKREVIYCDGTWGASAFVTSVIGNRGIAGSAAGAQAHDSGTPVVIVPLAQHIEDIHDRLDDVGTTYLPLAGGTLTGDVTLSYAGARVIFDNTATGDPLDFWRIRAVSNALSVEFWDNSAGTFSRVLGFEAGSIRPEIANNGLIPLGTAGQAFGNSFINKVFLVDGGPAFPALSFADGSDTGLYHLPGDGSLGVTVNGVLRIRVTDSDAIFTARLRPDVDATHNLGSASLRWQIGYINRLLADDGTAAAPSISFGSDTNTGIYRFAENELGVAANGTAAFIFRDTASGGNLSYSDLRPSADSVTDLGSSGLRWAEGYINRVLTDKVEQNNGPTWTSGAGTPQGVVTAPVGSMFSRTNGGAGTTLYVKESGAGNTGWVAK